MSYKVVFITSQGGTHPMHRRFADSINADYQFVDHKIRWQDIIAPAWKRYLSWVVSAWTFPGVKSYDIFLSGGQHFMPVLLRKLGRLKKRQKLVCFHDNETLFFMRSGKYSKSTIWALKILLPQYDAHIVTSDMTKSLLLNYLGSNAKIYQVFNGVEINRLNLLLNLHSDLSTKNLVFIGNIYAGWRSWYKGIDLMIDVFQELLMTDKTYTLTIIGDIIESEELKFKKIYPDWLLKKIFFTGKVKNIEEYLIDKSLYVHCARGESYGITVLEAMASGIPPIVSEWTGASEVVKRVDEKLIVPLNKLDIVERIKWYFGLPDSERLKLSIACKSTVISQSQDAAAYEFSIKFKELTSDLLGN